MTDKVYNVIIVGSGPAGHTAGLYLARANLEPLMFEGDLSQEVCPGGLLTTTKTVENYPGFPDGIDGYELTQRLKQQSTKFGLTVISEAVSSIVKTNDEFNVVANNKEYVTKSVIIATGSNPNKLPIKRYDDFLHKGISTCAVCDAGLPMFKNVDIAVVGGGDSAMEEALHIAHTASKVFIIHRRDKFRASKIMQERVFNNSKIEIIWNTEVIEVDGDDLLNKIILKNMNDEISELNVKGLFVAIGHTPNSLFVKDLVALDENGYIITDKHMKTNVNGIYACGDVQDKHWKQAITAAATGCIAALEVERSLS